MASPIASTTPSQCFCPEGKYDSLDTIDGFSPIWCFPNGVQRTPEVLDENRKSAMDVEVQTRCIPCPDCLDCTYPGYRGLPFVREGWTVHDERPPSEGGLPLKLPPGEPALVQPAFDGRPFRAVLGCPNKLPRCPTDEPECPTEQLAMVGYCIAELEYRNASSLSEMDMQTSSVAASKVCMDGYAGPVCGYCDEGFSMHKTGCEKCLDESYWYIVGYASAVVGGLLISLGVVPLCKKWKKARDFFEVIHDVIPAIKTDVR